MEYVVLRTHKKGAGKAVIPPGGREEEEREVGRRKGKKAYGSRQEVPASLPEGEGEEEVGGGKNNMECFLLFLSLS